MKAFCAESQGAKVRKRLVQAVLILYTGGNLPDLLAYYPTIIRIPSCSLWSNVDHVGVFQQ